MRLDNARTLLWGKLFNRMGRPRIRPLITVQCAFCGKDLVRPQTANTMRYNSFCNWEHRNLYKVGKEPSNKKWRTQSLVNEYLRVKDIVSRFPTYDDLLEHSVIYVSTYHKRFGTLDNLARLACPEFDPRKNGDDWSVDSLSPADGGWLSGLVAGEACFRLSKYRTSIGNIGFSAVFHIQLRADDIQVLYEIKRLWNVSHTIQLWNRENDRKRGVNAGDGAVLSIRDMPTLFSRVIPTFEKYPLRAKKQHDFELFKRAVAILSDKWEGGRRNSMYTAIEREELDQIFLALRDIKKYKTTREDIMKLYPAVLLG